jgi:hypothetical protein
VSCKFFFMPYVVLIVTTHHCCTRDRVAFLHLMPKLGPRPRGVGSEPLIRLAKAQGALPKPNESLYVDQPW